MRCVRCDATVAELVPWGDGNECLGCFKSSAPAAAADVVHLTHQALMLVKRAAPAIRHYEASRSVLLNDLAQHFFGGRLDMARGYQMACAQCADPREYALLMTPFYSLSTNNNN